MCLDLISQSDKTFSLIHVCMYTLILLLHNTITSHEVVDSYLVTVYTVVLDFL